MEEPYICSVITENDLRETLGRIILPARLGSGYLPWKQVTLLPEPGLGIEQPSNTPGLLLSYNQLATGMRF